MFERGSAAYSLFRRAYAPLLLAMLACGLVVPGVRAQSEKPAKSSRKLIHKVDADYPLDLQRAHIGGVVRLDVLVTAAGTVSNVSVVGGNPVLVETATRAVKQWKWAPADSESVVRITVNFDSPKD